MKRLVSFLKKRTIAIIMAIVLGLPVLASGVAKYFEHYYLEDRDIGITALYDEDWNWLAVCYIKGNHCMILFGADQIDIYL